MDKVESHRRWQTARHAELAGPESWLGLTGLYWLEPGINAVGSADDAMVKLPGGPAQQGQLNWEAGRIRWQPAAC